MTSKMVLQSVVLLKPRPSHDVYTDFPHYSAELFSGISKWQVLGMPWLAPTTGCAQLQRTGAEAFLWTEHRYGTMLNRTAHSVAVLATMIFPLLLYILPGAKQVMVETRYA